MIIPVCCFIFGSFFSDKWEASLGLLHTEYTRGDALHILGLKYYYSYCMALAHRGLIKNLLNYGPWRSDPAGASQLIMLTSSSLSFPEFIP
ncbi:DNA-directed RNA polymerases I, II, and III subunit RPABC5 [Pteropus vampyrus]|uniref:DNA-directed RNA polymerases I, II, and III subunit RPABC5 n=1 Tax=Pteropus vampyrus TaxID=132908 RepID=A0A6P3RL03_PTEVA|nr:DNA-directed RNA polymerases I, II, and III subunit RPABC5 [Pteropus vampyrus]